jgi:NADH-quinone oxidoreductase subunit J
LLLNASIQILEEILTDPALYITLLLAGFLLTSLFVILAKKLIWIITAIGIGSVLLAILFFIFDAPFAGAFELSVGAGLISVLFIIATSLTRSLAEQEDL